MNTRQHADGPDGPDTDDLGFRDAEEERAYEQAQGETSRPDSPAPADESHGKPPQAGDDVVDAQAEPDDGEPANAG